MREDDLLKRNLALAYDRRADERDQREIADWKNRERERFLGLLRAEGKSSLVDIGSGPGTHAVYFREHGIDVTCVDLSPVNVERCRGKGLRALLGDVMDLGFLGGAFHAAFAMNSLLHVPRARLPKTLASIRDTLCPTGLFYWGQYGGVDRQGIFEEDTYEPKRYFSFLDDEEMSRVASEIFSLQEFVRVPLEDDEPFHFQSLILRVQDWPSH